MLEVTTQVLGISLYCKRKACWEGWWLKNEELRGQRTRLYPKVLVKDLSTRSLDGSTIVDIFGCAIRKLSRRSWAKCRSTTPELTAWHRYQSWQLFIFHLVYRHISKHGIWEMYWRRDRALVLSIQERLIKQHSSPLFIFLVLLTHSPEEPGTKHLSMLEYVLACLSAMSNCDGKLTDDFSWGFYVTNTKVSG